VEARFIEFMPLDDGHRWRRDLVVTADEIVERINARWALTPRGRGNDKSSTSLKFGFTDGSPGGIGVIAPVSRPFCGACSRLRVTCDGKVRPCLFSRDEFDLRPVLRGASDDEAVAGFIRDSVWTKQAGHGIGGAEFRQPERTMSAIGG
jgi:cyclic pyranopterin phosphate synthase